MPLTKPFTNPHSPEKSTLSYPSPDHSPPPVYTSEAPSVANDTTPDITAAFSSLNLDTSAFPTPDQCLAHLKLLEAFHQLREDVALRDGLFGIRDSSVSKHASEEKQREVLMKIREKRWAVYVAKAVKRFEKWWAICVCPQASKLEQKQMQAEMTRTPDRGEKMNIDINQLPPIDVIMVWHAYQLNPRDFLEDCIRYGKLGFWRAGFPWAPINACIDNDTFQFKPTEKAKHNWKFKTGYAWDSLEDSGDAILTCPKCKKFVKVPWTGCNREGAWDDDCRTSLGDIARGFADKAMKVQCNNCHIYTSHEDLKLAKFRNDIEALMIHDYPMPGTILNLKGIPETPKDLVRHEPLFPNRLLKTSGSLYANVRTRTTPGKPLESMDGIRTEIEDALKSKSAIRVANHSYNSRLRKEERIAIRRMMSRYWGNSSPFALDLIGAVIRQGSFIEKMHAIDWIHSPAAPSTMKRLITKYQRYIDIINAYPNQIAVPTLDVDLAWHTHQLSPPAYYDYTVSRTGVFIDHDDKIDETKLSTAFEWTSKTYQKLYKELYSECTCWYCEAIRESHTSSLSRLFSSDNEQIESHLDQLHSASDQKFGPHISSHNAIKPETVTDRAKSERAFQYKLECDYRKACQRAQKKGREPPRRDDYMYAYAWGYPMYIPYYAPYMGDPCVTGDMYPANPACASFVPGASGNCCAGSCGGGVAAGSCGGGGAGGCAGGGTVGGCGGGGCGGGGGGGCGGGGGGGGGG
ncbi:MAG: hypothetical protein Q9217_000531 [Psora testacea]